MQSRGGRKGANIRLGLGLGFVHDIRAKNLLCKPLRNLFNKNLSSRSGMGPPPLIESRRRFDNDIDIADQLWHFGSSVIAFRWATTSEANLHSHIEDSICTPGRCSVAVRK